MAFLHTTKLPFERCRVHSKSLLLSHGVTEGAAIWISWFQQHIALRACLVVA